MSSSSLLQLVERAYEPSGSLLEWLGGLADAAAPVVERSLGTAARLVRLDPPLSLGMEIRVPDPVLAQALRDHDERAKHRRGDIVLRGNPGLRRMRADTDPDDPIVKEMRARFDPLGLREMCHLTACDGRGHCVTVGFLLREEKITGIGRATWSKAAVHLATAFRLRGRMQDLLDVLTPDGAVLEPDGRIIDADGMAKVPSAREQLREAVRRIDVSRTGREREFALDVWKGLVDGRWSIVDRHDRDGRRYFVAVPNEVSLPAPHALSRREAQVAALASEGYSDKWIAYALGLSRTAVSSHLHAALRKLALPSRTALAKAFGPTTPAEPEV